ncbi:hypothetical protein [Klebsiella variicola]|uniref:hypothetical protein n=1 Tax=Klebsiella variicola TaxID=244366 RepID=UPI00352AB907
MKNQLLMIALLPALMISGYACSDTIDTNILGRINGVADIKKMYLDGLYISRNTFGMRANAAAAAITANSLSPFNFPILGLNATVGLARYLDRDSVGLYASNESTKFNDWELIKNGHYTPTSFQSSEIDIKKIKAGMIIETTHQVKWGAMVVRVYPGKIITSGWVNLSTGRMGTPPDNAGIQINPITKIWATNFNIFLSKDGRASKAVVQENGVINNKEQNPSSIYGIDNVILPQSMYGGTISYLSRSATSGNGQQWAFGFMAKGSKKSNFVSADGGGKEGTEVGFSEISSAKNGIMFYGRNQDSSITWTSNGRVTAKISPDGSYEKIVYKTKLITTSYNITDDYSKYIVNAKDDVKINLPAVKNETEGLTIQIINFSNNKINIESSADVIISGQLGKNITASIVNGKWMVY